MQPFEEIGADVVDPALGDTLRERIAMYQPWWRDEAERQLRGRILRNPPAAIGGNNDNIGNHGNMSIQVRPEPQN